MVSCGSPRREACIRHGGGWIGSMGKGSRTTTEEVVTTCYS
jgi:hypothetical protein